MDKNICDNCYELGEQHYGDKLDKTYYYCCIIEQAIEDAIEIKDIKKCPRDLLKEFYRVGEYERKKWTG